MAAKSLFYIKAKEYLENKYISEGCTGKLIKLKLNDISFGCVSDNNTLEVVFEQASWSVEYTETDGQKDIEGTDTTHKLGLSVMFTVGFKTPKGYISSKKIPVDFEYKDRDLNERQINELLKYQTDAVKNTFDPFYKENQAKSRNAAAWNYVAQNYITHPWNEG